MVIGCSRVGIYLTDMLVSLGKNVIVIDKDREKCEAVFDMIPDATIIHGDANDQDFLMEEGFGNMDAVVTLTDSDEINFLLSVYAQKIGVPKTVTKINNKHLNRLLDDLGLDSQINVSELSVSAITQYVRAKENISSSYIKRFINWLTERSKRRNFSQVIM